MRVLILDDDNQRARRTADLLGGQSGLNSEAAACDEGVERLEGGEWFDLVVAETPEEAGPGLLARLGRLPSPPPLVALTPPRVTLAMPPWVHAALPRSPGYEERLPGVVREVAELHRARKRLDQLRRRLEVGRKREAILRRHIESAREGAEKDMHTLVHGLHALSAVVPDETARALEPLLDTAARLWESLEGLGDLARHAPTETDLRCLTPVSELLREIAAVTAGGIETGTGCADLSVLADPAEMAQALAELAASTEDTPWQVRLERGELTIELPWQGDADGSAVEAVRILAEEQNGRVQSSDGTLRIGLPTFHREEVPQLLLEDALRRAERKARDFTLMRIEGGGTELAASRAAAVIKSTDQVLTTEDGGLLLLLHGLSTENAWGVAKRLQEALEDTGRMLAFRTLHFPSETRSATDFMERARATGMVSG